MPAENIGEVELLDDSAAFNDARLPISPEEDDKWKGKAITGTALLKLVGTALVRTGEAAPTTGQLTAGRRALYFRTDTSGDVIGLHVSLDGLAWKEVATGGGAGNIHVIGATTDIPVGTTENQMLLFVANRTGLSGFVDTDGTTAITTADSGDIFILVSANWKKIFNIGGSAGSDITVEYAVTDSSTDSDWHETQANADEYWRLDIDGTATPGIFIGTPATATSFDIHDDISDELETPATTDRIPISDESETGDPMKYVEYGTIKDLLTLGGHSLVTINPGNTTHTAANTIGLTLHVSVASYINGLAYFFRAKLANTGNVTLSLDSLATRSLRKSDGTQFAAGELEAGQYVVAVYSTSSGHFISVNLHSRATEEEVYQYITDIIQAGDNVTLTEDDANNEFTIASADPGTGGGTDLAVQDDGTEIDDAPEHVNFTGDGVTVTVDGDGVEVAVPGGTGDWHGSRSPRRRDRDRRRARTYQLHRRLVEVTIDGDGVEVEVTGSSGGGGGTVLAGSAERVEKVNLGFCAVCDVPRL